MKTYRSLTQEEIQQLKERSCTAVDWAEIEVVENFKTDYICHTRFSGRVNNGFHPTNQFRTMTIQCQNIGLMR